MSRVYDFASGNSWGVSSDFSYETPKGTGETIVVSHFAEAGHGHEDIDDAVGTIDHLTSEEIDATLVFADEVEATDVFGKNATFVDLRLGETLYFQGEPYVITDKYHKSGATLDDDEIDTENKTIVVRDKVNGCRVSNLQVRADSGSPFVGSYPGLFFTEGTCSEQLNLIEDGKIYFSDLDSAGTVIPGSFAQFGRYAAGVFGVTVESTAVGRATLDSGRLFLQAGIGQSDPSPYVVFAVLNKLGNVAQGSIDCRGTYTGYRSGITSGVPMMQCRKTGTNDLLWSFRSDGFIEFEEYPLDDPTHAAAGSAPAISTHSVVTSDSSVYIGSGKISFDRATHELVFHKLKLTGLPKYFDDLGYTNANLPSGYNLAAMSVQRYLALARDLASDDTLHVEQVFPAANATADWVDAGGLGTSGNPTSHTIENGGGTAELIVRSTNSAVADGQISLKMHLDRGGSSTFTQDVDFEFTNDDHSMLFQASFPSEHANQAVFESFRCTPGGKLFVQGGIQNGHTNINTTQGFVVACPSLYKDAMQCDGATLTLGVNSTLICGAGQTDLIGRVSTLEAAGGGSSLTVVTISTTGGSGNTKSLWPTIGHHTLITLSGGVTRYICPASPAEGDEVHIRWSADTHTSSLTLGTIGNTFHWHSIGSYQANDQMSLTNPHVTAKLVVRFEHGQWVVELRTHSGTGRFHKSFSHTATHKSGNPYLLPSGYMNYTCILGDNSNYVTSGNPAFNAQTFGCHISLPYFVKDGAKVHFETHLNKNSSSATEVIVVKADLFGGRKLRDEFGTLHTTNPTYRSVTSNIYNTRSFDYVWNALYSTWICHQEVN